MGSVSLQTKTITNTHFLASEQKNCDGNDRRTMRTNPVETTPRDRAPPPVPCQSPSSHVHLGSYGSNKMTSPDYLFVTLLVVKLQRRTDQNDLEINLTMPTLEVVSPYPDLEEESFYLILPLPQASPQEWKIPWNQTNFSRLCKQKYVHRKPGENLRNLHS